MEKIIKFNGKEYNVDIEFCENVDIEKCVDILNSDELFDYLYAYHIDMFNEINEDPYYNGKTVKSGKDLKNSIEKISLIKSKNGVVYICGEYWCDDEHGFSIKLPNGEFVKSQYSTFDFSRDQGKEVNYKPICTLLGQYSDSF